LTAESKTEARPRILILGYGNPARLDDGLGPALLEQLATAELQGLTLDSDYQLTVEDAATVAEHDAVIFVDAAATGAEPFSFTRVEPREEISFSTHSVSPAAVLGLAQHCFQADVPGYALGIRGYEFNGFGEGLSDRAGDNLSMALAFLIETVHNGDFEAAVAEHGGSDTGPTETCEEPKCRTAST
jgi:hydrogenase maturation protease